MASKHMDYLAVSKHINNLVVSKHINNDWHVVNRINPIPLVPAFLRSAGEEDIGLFKERRRFNLKIKRKIITLLGCLLIVLSCLDMVVYAEAPLPDGAVKGLPERLAALDDEGRAVNTETGEYFFHVEGMALGETYTKNIQLINLREDEAYHIYFCVEPLYKSGEIDLEDGCTCRFLLDGEEFYFGDVNGVGNIDLTEYYDCGYYAPGDSHILRCEITFNKMVIDKSVDYGWRLVDKDGTHVLRNPDGDGYVYGEIEFKWIFCAEVVLEGQADNNANNALNPPKTGILYRDGRVWLISMSVVAVLIVVMLVLIMKQKDKNSDQKENSSDQIVNNSDHKDNGSDQIVNNSAQKDNGSDQIVNNSDQKSKY